MRPSLHHRLIEGKPETPCLVFLHEGLGCDAMWKGFPDLLCQATGYSGLAYDRLGYGKSPALTRQRSIHYLHAYALVELPQLLEQVIPGRDYILIGHSDGGSISLILGAEQPRRLKGIITEAAHVFVEPETITGIQEAEAAWKRGSLKRLVEYHGEKTEAIFKAWSATWLSERFKYWNIEYLLPSIEAPLLVIQGKDDQYGSVAQVNAIVEKSTGPARREIIENCGHTPHLEAESLVLQLMADFITAL